MFVISIEKENARAEITVTDDAMRAYLTLYPQCNGGWPLKRKQLRQIIKDAGIVRGIIDENLNDALERLQYLHRSGPLSWVLAQGETPQTGKDTEFVPLVPVYERRPKINLNGEVNLQDMGKIPFVSVGCEVMERRLPTRGASGFKVTGEEVEGTMGELFEFAKNLQNVKASEADENVLVATEEGKPIIVENGVQVERIVSMPEANYATGHVEFDGNVHIDGDVTSVNITCGGDLYIGGTVDRSNIRAGGDVQIIEGVVGPLPPHSEENPLGHQSDWSTEIICGGSFMAEYVVSSHIRAGKDIVVHKAIRNSVSQAGNGISVGENAGGLGTIVGGYASATHLIKTQNISAVSNPATLVQVGVDPVGLKEPTEELIAELEKRLTDYRGDKSKGDLPVNERTNALRQIQDQLYHLKQRARGAAPKQKQQEPENQTKPHVVVTYEVFGGTTISINRLNRYFPQRASGGNFILRSQDILRTKIE